MELIRHNKALNNALIVLEELSLILSVQFSVSHVHQVRSLLILVVKLAHFVRSLSSRMTLEALPVDCARLELSRILSVRKFVRVAVPDSSVAEILHLVLLAQLVDFNQRQVNLTVSIARLVLLILPLAKLSVKVVCPVVS